MTSIVQVTNTWWPVNEASDSVCTCLHKHLMEKLTKSYPEDTSEEQFKESKNESEGKYTKSHPCSGSKMKVNSHFEAKS